MTRGWKMRIRSDPAGSLFTSAGVAGETVAQVVSATTPAYGERPVHRRLNPDDWQFIDCRIPYATAGN